MDDVLKYAIEHGILDLAQIKNEIEMSKREELLHKHPFKVWEGTNGYWYTYVPDKEKGRILKKKKSKKDIEDLIIKYIKETDDNPTIEEIFNIVTDEKLLSERINVYTSLTRKYTFYSHLSDIKDKRIKEINDDFIQDFLYEHISKNKISIATYQLLKYVVIDIFKYAKRKKYINFYISNVLNDMDIPSNSFKKKKIKKDEDEVFQKEEVRQIYNYITMNSNHIADYGILLAFSTGVRIGELCALKWSDIHENYLYIQRTLTRCANGTEVIGTTTKTEAGNRIIALPSSAIPIINKMRSLNPNTEYVFQHKSRNYYTTPAFRYRLSIICKELGIEQKSFHKIRKTYASILLDAKMDNRFVTEQLGHKNVLITERIYHKNRKTMEEKSELLNSISDFSNQK